MVKVMISIHEVITIALLSGTLIYNIWNLITYFFSNNAKIKKISSVSLLAGTVYLVVIPILYLTRSNLILSFVIVTISYAVKFLLERRMLSYSKYERIIPQLPHYILGLISILTIVLMAIGIKNTTLFFSLLILTNLVVSVGWFIEKGARIIGFTSIISSAFLLLVNDKSLALLLSLIPYGFNSIFMNSKDYTNTVSSLFVISQYGEAILEEQIEEYKDFIYLLINKVESRYSQREMHSINVKAISEGIALEMGLDHKSIDYISSASMIHDIGYLGVDHRGIGESIQEEDPKTIKHIWIGKFILENSDIFIKYLPVVLYHHENLDGSGPEKLKGENIPLSAKIVRVADVFERMINGRNGKKYTIKEALEYIKKNKDKLFDSEVVNALERYIYKNY